TLVAALAAAAGATLLGASDRLETIAVVAAALAIDACSFVGFALVEEASRQRRQGFDVSDRRLVLSEGLWGVRVSTLGALSVAALAFLGLAWTAFHRSEGVVLA